MSEQDFDGLEQILEVDLKYKKLSFNRFGEHYLCDFCKVSLDNECIPLRPVFIF